MADPAMHTTNNEHSYMW